MGLVNGKKRPLIYMGGSLENPLYCCEVTIDHSRHTIGRFKSEEEAIQARDAFIDTLPEARKEKLQCFVDLQEHPEKFIGQKYGRLTIDKIELKNKRTMAYCTCECGNHIVGSFSYLKLGHLKSCGCSLEKNLRGKTFGQLTVLDMPSKRGGRNVGSVWTCRCSCGKIVEVQGESLRTGAVISCGHERKENAGDNMKKDRREGTRIGSLINVLAHPKKPGYDPKSGKYKAEFRFQKKRYWLGSFYDEKRAEEVVRAASAAVYADFISAYHDRVLAGEEEASGVAYSYSTKSWRAVMMIDGKRTALGYFKNKIDAIHRRFEEEDKLLDEYEHPYKKEQQ